MRSSSKHIVDLQQLESCAFEELIEDILRAEGLENVTLQPQGTPAFDIIATEDMASQIHGFHRIKWGIQCKCYKNTVSPSIFDEISTEALKKDIDCVLLVTSSEFRARTVEHGSTIQKTTPRIKRVEFWNGVDVRRKLVRHPHLLKNYFNIDIRTLAEVGSEPSAQDLEQLLGEVSRVSGVSLHSIEELVPAKHRFYMKAYSKSTGDPRSLVAVRPLADAMRRYIDLVEIPSSALINAENSGFAHYNEYFKIRHRMILEAPVQVLQGDHPKFRRITDEVACEVVLQRGMPLVFDFVTNTNIFEAGHTKQRNEYTWLLDRQVIDARRVASLISVEDAMVAGMRLRCIEKQVTPDRIRFTMTAPSLRSLAGKRISIGYRVRNIHGADSRAMFSRLHAPTSNYSFELLSRHWDTSAIRVTPFLGANTSNGVTKQITDGELSGICFSANRKIAINSGAMIRW